MELKKKVVLLLFLLGSSAGQWEDVVEEELLFEEITANSTAISSPESKIKKKDLMNLVKVMLKLLAEKIHQILGHIDENVSVSYWQDKNIPLAEQMTSRVKSDVKELIVLDKAHHNILPDFHGNETSETFFLSLLLANISPILNVSDSCYNESKFYLQHLITGELWAIRMLDASGKVPDGYLSNYVEICNFVPLISNTTCKDAGLEWAQDILKFPLGNSIAMGSYSGCLDEKINNVNGEQKGLKTRFFYMKLAPTNKMFNILEGIQLNSMDTKYELFNNFKLIGLLPAVVEHSMLGNVTLLNILLDAMITVQSPKWGQCIPSACTDTDVLSNSMKLYNNKLIGIPLSNATVDTKTPDIDKLAIIMILVMSIIGCSIVVGTLLDVLEGYNLLDRQSRGIDVLVSIFKCFSINTNVRKIMNIDDRGHQKHIPCLDGIRALSMFWAFLGPLWLMNIFFQVKNPKDVLDEVTGKGALFHESILNTLTAVDTFFFLSGLLLAFWTFQELDSKKCFNIITFYFHRYIRLTIPLVFVIGFVATISQYFVSGPKKFMYEIQSINNCRKNWWMNLLYVNNFQKSEEQCLFVAWYLANDMQMFIFSPVILLPLWKWKKFGLFAWTFWMVFFVSIIAGLVIYFDLPLVLTFSSFERDGFKMIEDFYFMPYVRIPPYLLGILFGYLLYNTKDKEAKIPNWLNVLFWQASMVTVIAVVFGLHKARGTLFSPYNHESNIFASVMYHCIYRIAWGICLGWFIFACVKGYGGIINSFLSWGLFKPTARMSYFIYLINVEVVLMFFASMEYTVEYSDYQMLIYYIGLMGISHGIALIGTLAFEMPFQNLEKWIFRSTLDSLHY